MKKSILITVFVTIYLVIASIIGQFGVSLKILLAMFSLWPIMVISMVIVVLKDSPVHIRELEENEHWGYLDKSKTAEG